MNDMTRQKSFKSKTLFPFVHNNRDQERQRQTVRGVRGENECRLCPPFPLCTTRRITPKTRSEKMETRFLMKILYIFMTREKLFAGNELTEQMHITSVRPQCVCQWLKALNRTQTRSECRRQRNGSDVLRCAERRALALRSAHEFNANAKQIFRFQ